MKLNSRRVGCAPILLPLLIAIAAHAAPYPSPADWRNENIYQIFTDRFDDGDPSNNNLEASRGEPYSPANPTGIHGGDFKGIQQKLDYIKALGATAIWISPIPLNVGNGSSAYHGYAAQDFYTLAPHWGTMADLSNMVQAAHARGIKVILDVVCNHTGPLVTSTDPGWPNFLAPPNGYNLQYANINNQHAFPFNPTNVIPPLLSTLFHTNGYIQNFGDTQQVVLGELEGLDDLATETTYVRTNLMNIYTNWVGRADFDAFRVDTAKHVDYGFWQYWCPQMRQFGSSIGKSNFIMFGEAFDSSESLVGSYTGTEGGGPFKFDSMLDYPLYYTINPVFSQAYANTSQIEDHYNAIAANYDSNAWYRLITFLDNHDNARFLSPGNANGDTNRLSVALAFLYTSRGIPCLYYGTEQAFNGTGDPNNREDMFAGEFEEGPSLGDNFDEAHPLFQLVAKLNNFRRLYPALRTGVHNNLWSDPNGPGLFAYSRVLSNQEVFVCFNTAASSLTLTNRPIVTPAGTILVNLLNTNDTIVVTTAFGTNATPQITVPGMTARIYIAQSQVLPLDPAIISQSPSHAATCVAASAPIVLQFSKPMNTNSVQAAFSVTPSTAGTFTWNTAHDTMTFTPSAPWPVFITNSVHLATNAVDSVSSNSLFAPFDTFFVTFTTNTISTGSSPPAGGTTSGGGLVNCGSNMTVCATPNACYSFLYWSQNGSLVSTSACYTFSATGNEAVVANFVNGQGTLVTDNAADPAYAGGWFDGTDGGSGFGPWALVATTPNSGCNGFFAGTSIASSPHARPGIDVNGMSWGMYANYSNCGEPTIATAFRAFANGSLQPGSQVMLDMQNGYNDTSGSAVGFTLRNGDTTNSPTDYATGGRFGFFLGGGNADYMVADAAGYRDSGVPLTYSGVHLVFTLGANDAYTLTIVSYGTGSMTTITGTLGGTPGTTLDSIALFNNDAGSDSPHDLFFNSLIVANVTPITYSINTASSPVNGGTTSGGAALNCGSNITVCATPNSCYSFGYWTRGGIPVSASPCYTFAVTGTETVVANFVKGQGNVAIDSAADPAYGGPQIVWPNGSNGGVGFGSWVITQTFTNRSCNGSFCNTSTNSDSPPHAPPGIDTNGKAWGLFANSDCGSAASAAAYRALGSGPVQVGGQVLLDMDNGSNDVANSAAGFALRNGNSTNGPTSYVNSARLQFYLAGGASVYRVIDGSGVRNTTVPMTYSGLHLIFTLGTNDTYTLTVVSYGTGLTNVITGTLAGTTGSTLDSIALFNSKNGSKPPHDVFFNSLAVVNVFPYLSMINASASPAGGGTITGGGSVSCGSNVTLCATPVSCYQFVNWTESGNVVGTTPCLVVQAIGNQTYVANFTHSTTDSVGDGILDCWRQRYFGGTGTSTNTSSCATCDADGTGQNNRFKFVAGLNPTNPASVFVLQIQTVPNQPTHKNLMYWPIATGCTYVVESTTSLVAGVWSPQAVSAPLTNGIQVTVMDPNATGPVKFYRVEIYNVITNIVIQDSVGDGISDGWRAQYFAKVDPTGATTNNLSCAACDADGTGQNNLFKYVTGLDPTNPASVFLLQITSSTNRPPQNNLLFTPLALGRSYTPQFATNLASGSWFPLTTYTGPVTNNGSQATITDTNPIPPQEFYRIGISQP